MRLVLDTDVIVSAFRSPTGASAALLRAIGHGKATMLAGVALFLEYEAICMEPEHRKAARLSIVETRAFLSALAYLAEPVEMHFHWRPQLRDPGDEMVLETAVNGRADWLVTYNTRDYGEAPKLFGIGLATSKVMLDRLSK